MMQMLTLLQVDMVMDIERVMKKVQDIELDISEDNREMMEE